MAWSMLGTPTLTPVGYLHPISSQPTGGHALGSPYPTPWNSPHHTCLGSLGCHLHRNASDDLTTQIGTGAIPSMLPHSICHLWLCDQGSPVDDKLP